MSPNADSLFVIGRVVGRGSSSFASLFDCEGQKLVDVHGPSTNLWLVGIGECKDRINAMIQQAKEKAGLPRDLILKALSLSLVGCNEGSKMCQQLRRSLVDYFPDLSFSYVMMNCCDEPEMATTSTEIINNDSDDIDSIVYSSDSSPPSTESCNFTNSAAMMPVKKSNSLNQRLGKFFNGLINGRRGIVKKSSSKKKVQGPFVVVGIKGRYGRTVVILFDQNGEPLAEMYGPSTNFWLVGIDECQSRINFMIQAAKEKAELPHYVTVRAVGLDLMTIRNNEPEPNYDELKRALAKTYPNLSASYVVCNSDNDEMSVESIARMVKSAGLLTTLRPEVQGSNGDCISTSSGASFNWYSGCPTNA